MLARRATADTATPASGRAGGAGRPSLLEAAELDLDTFFAVAGERLEAFLRELNQSRRVGGKARSA